MPARRAQERAGRLCAARATGSGRPAAAQCRTRTASPGMRSIWSGRARSIPGSVPMSTSRRCRPRPEVRAVSREDVRPRGGVARTGCTAAQRQRGHRAAGAGNGGRAAILADPAAARGQQGVAGAADRGRRRHAAVRDRAALPAGPDTCLRHRDRGAAPEHRPGDRSAGRQAVDPAAQAERATTRRRRGGARDGQAAAAGRSGATVAAGAAQVGDHLSGHREGLRQGGRDRALERTSRAATSGRRSTVWW